TSGYVRTTDLGSNTPVLNYDPVTDAVIAFGMGRMPTAFALSFANTLGAPSSAGAGISLSSGWPNPARDRTTFAFTLARAGVAHLSVLDVSGRRIRSWTCTAQAGSNTLAWDLTTERGTRVGPGLFLCSLDVDGQRLVRRFLVIR